MKKSKSMIVLLLTCMMLVMAACSSGGGDAAKSETSTEIKFWTISLSPTFDDYINGMVDTFEKDNPGVKVKWEDIPIDAVEQKTLTSSASGNLADVVNLNTEFLKKLASLGALANMDELAADVKGDFYEGVWTAGEYKGSTYALPWYLANDVVLYNKDLLKKAGFDTPPTTVDEAWEMTKVIKEKTGAYGYSLTTIRDELLYSGIPILNEDFTKAAFNVPQAVEIFAKYKERNKEGLIPEEILLDQAKPQEWYAQEKLAWWQTGPNLFRQVNDLAPAVYEKSDATSSFAYSTGQIPVNTMNIAVSEKSKNKDAAVKFAKFVTNAENQLQLSKLSSVLPSAKKAAEDTFFAAGKDSTDPVEKGRYLAVNQLEKSMDLLPPVENLADINRAINDEFKRMLSDDLDPADAVAAAEDAVNKLLQ
ncbi:ABC transporter substrate-binding protein [Paenibacillus segetis]|uniref:Sugar ABC transporter substrate-binding protein n=1 Tax=Paenibacillus segetis TaxID=1325360 RepID=A0ABQ1YII3_9BACL|nr:sugar ABC transporter substrate-binding protein [Paenibacillus segetis]GGH27535.1 sugar ABC transporter substrate-binding protein [Paenibacillus segetis]